MNPEYTRVAHRRTVWAAVQRLLRDKYLDAEDPASEHLVCEQALYEDRIVSQDAIHDVLDVLQQLEAREEQELRSFKLSKNTTETKELPTVKKTVKKKDPEAT